MFLRASILLIAAACAFAPAIQTRGADAPPATSPTIEERMTQFEKRMEAMEKKHKDELNKRDAEIAELKSELTKAKTSTQTSETQVAESKMQADAIDKMTSDILKDINKREVEKPPLQRFAANFNPDIAVIGNFVASASNRNGTKAHNRADVAEIELDIRAAVDPRADAVFVLPFARDATEPLFADEVLTGPETSAGVEEAYLFFHDFGVPNLTAKIGRYHVRFGRQNVLHSHDLPTVDSPFVLQSFLAPEALVDSGIELSYVVPNPWNQYIETILEINSGEGAGSESPTLKGDLGVSSPAIVWHNLWNMDLGKEKEWNLELGNSLLFGHADPDNGHTVQLYGFDATLIRTDPSGNFNNQLFQFEAIYGHVDQPDGRRNNSWGAYLLGQQQVSKDFYVGLRLDYTQDANNNGRAIWGAAPYVSWYWSEFLRFRVQYEHRAGDVPEEDILFFQMTFIIGAHPPHPYWATK